MRPRRDDRSHDLGPITFGWQAILARPRQAVCVLIAPFGLVGAWLTLPEHTRRTRWMLTLSAPQTAVDPSTKPVRMGPRKRPFSYVCLPHFVTSPPKRACPERAFQPGDDFPQPSDNFAQLGDDLPQLDDDFPQLGDGFVTEVADMSATL